LPSDVAVVYHIGIGVLANAYGEASGHPSGIGLYRHCQCHRFRDTFAIALLSSRVSLESVGLLLGIRP
jgi:hypothetical protein